MHRRNRTNELKAVLCDIVHDLPLAKATNFNDATMFIIQQYLIFKNVP